jgi:hypothetical protein
MSLRRRSFNITLIILINVKDINSLKDLILTNIYKILEKLKLYLSLKITKKIITFLKL